MVKNLKVEIDNCDFSGEWPKWTEKLIVECKKLIEIEANPDLSEIYKKYYKLVIFRKATKHLHC